MSREQCTEHHIAEEIAARLAAAGVSGDAAKQMMAAVKSGGGRKYLNFCLDFLKCLEYFSKLFGACKCF